MIATLTEETCDSERIVEFLQKIKEKYPDRKIVVVLDNARYNYAIATRAFAEENNINLLFLPPYAPNLNLIERLWKFTKKHLVSNSRFISHYIFLILPYEFLVLNSACRKNKML